MASEKRFESGYTYTIVTPLKRPIDAILSSENEYSLSRMKEYTSPDTDLILPENNALSHSESVVSEPMNMKEQFLKIL